METTQKRPPIHGDVASPVTPTIGAPNLLARPVEVVSRKFEERLLKSHCLCCLLFWGYYLFPQSSLAPAFNKPGWCSRALPCAIVKFSTSEDVGIWRAVQRMMPKSWSRLQSRTLLNTVLLSAVSRYYFTAIVMPCGCQLFQEE